jgi:hypothetical protein
MDNAWLMALGTGACNAGVALAGKGAERSRCRPAAYAMIVFAGAGAGAFATTLGRTVAWGVGLLWVFGATMGCLYLVAIAAMVLANRHWTPSLVWGTANMAFIIPIALSAALLAEPLKAMDAAIVLGVGLMLAGLAAGGAATGSGGGTPVTPAWRRWGLLAAVFVANGALMFGFKLFGRVLPEASSASLIAAVYGCGALAAAVWAGRGLASLRRAEMGYGLGAGAASALAGLAMLGAMRLPAATAFPVIQGSSLVGGVLLCALVFRERLTVRKLAALAVGLGAMTLTIWR